MVSLKNLSRKFLRTAKSDAFLITNRTNVRYCTGLDFSVASILASERGMDLFVDGRYAEVAQLLSLPHLVVRAPNEFPDAIKKHSRVAFESDDVTVSRLTLWKKKFRSVRFIPVSGIVELSRRVKRPDELSCIKRACTITKKLLALVPRLLTKGVSEREVSFELCRAALRFGADEMSFETIVAFGKNSSRPHHRPTDTTLRTGDVVQIDIGVRVQGYCSDYSRVYFFGKKTAEYKQVERALFEAKRAAEELVRPGADVRTLDRKAREILAPYGYDTFFVHSLGHGVGLDIHESPTISHKSPPRKLLRGEVITIEPGVYFPGRFGMRLEDTLIVS